jgi:hypothetical protein
MGRIRFLLVKELEDRVKAARERLPHRCTYNYRQPLDVRRTIDDEPNPNYNRITMGSGPGGRHLPVLQTIGLCMYGVEDITSAAIRICEDPSDAQQCPLFEPTLNKHQLWTEYAEQIDSPDWLRENMPEVHGLAWALGEGMPRIPWWARLWFRLTQIRPEPIRIPTDLVKYLPDPNSLQ